MSESSSEPVVTAPDAPIVCHVTSWYYRRMLIMLVLLFGMGCVFFYDGQWGYNNANLKRDEYDRVTEGQEVFELTRDAASLGQWLPALQQLAADPDGVVRRRTELLKALITAKNGEDAWHKLEEKVPAMPDETERLRLLREKAMDEKNTTPVTLWTALARLAENNQVRANLPKVADGAAVWKLALDAEKYPLNEKGEPIRWTTYAAGKGWAAESPKRYTQEDIAGQFYCGGGMIALSLIPLFLILRERKRVLSADGQSFTTSDGRRIGFDEVFKVDKRRWDKEGLAIAWYKKGESGTEKKARIDDLKYGGAGKILDRILGRFTGVIIDKVHPAPVDESAEIPAQPLNQDKS